MIQIDAHQHFWRLERGDYGWLTPDLAAIYRDFMPADLAPLLVSQRIDRTILIQAAPSAAETAFLLELAGTVPFVAGVVGWTELDVPDAAEAIARLAGHHLLVGLRPMLQDLPEPDWILRPDLAPAIRAMIAHGLRLDALVKPQHLPFLGEFLRRWPDLPVVIDHGAKPAIADGGLAAWRGAMAPIARASGVCCKLSGLLTEAGPDWRRQNLRPYLDALLDMFGPDRLMWGSDWPVLTLAGAYNEWASLCADWASSLDASAQAAIFGGTAARFYGVSR